MLKHKLVVFVGKRVLFCCAILTIIDVILLENKWFILAGLLLGSAFGLLKFGSNEWISDKVVQSSIDSSAKEASAKSSMLVIILNQILVFPVLFAAFLVNNWFLTGAVAGILLVPFVLLVNGITEATGITRNNFGE